MRRLCLLIPLLALASPANANGAMGLGLEMFSMETWTVYVVVTLVFEAWFIGRFFKRSWPASLGISILANFITGFGCISICAVGLHQSFVGSRLNPNPFLNAVVLFTGFGLVSAVVEAAVWALFRADRSVHNPLLWRSVLAHLIGVPLGLAILLIPSHPYVGVIAWTNQIRMTYLESRLRRGIPNLLDDTNPFPCVKSLPELLKLLPPSDYDQPDEWAACYEANLSRFAMGENRSKPIAELNPALCGFKLPKDSEPASGGTMWIIRRRNNDFASGLLLDRQTGQIRRTIDAHELGFN